MDNMKVPSRKDTMLLLEKYGILPNILEHSIMVNKVAVFLAKKLVDAGEQVDIAVVDRASLLHDVAKSRTLIEKTEDKHHIEAENILTAEGYPALGHVCRMHSLREIKNLKTWEEKIVNYADTRVKHSEIVSMKARIDDLTKRYNVPASERLTYNDLLPLENEIFSKLKIKPNDVKRLIENESNTSK
jgi:putative nucleotidyltransferase with HDIG domain